jgi:hypothetical protein
MKELRPISVALRAFETSSTSVLLLSLFRHLGLHLVLTPTFINENKTNSVVEGQNKETNELRGLSPQANYTH